MRTRIYLILICLLVICCLIDTKGQGVNQIPRAGQQVNINEGLVGDIIDNYWIYLPVNFSTEKKYPIILFLQGKPGIGTDSTKVIRFGVDKHTFMYNADKELNTFVKDSFIIVNPHMKPGDYWERQWYQQYNSINSILDYVIDIYSGDSERVYVTGLSRGGHGTWGIGQLLKERVAAIIPICGEAHGVTDFSCFKDMPIWVTCNTGDGLYQASVDAVEKIEKSTRRKFLRLDTAAPKGEKYLRSRHIFTSFEKEGHNAWSATYDKVEIYKWLLKQKRR